MGTKPSAFFNVLSQTFSAILLEEGKDFISEYTVSSQYSSLFFELLDDHITLELKEDRQAKQLFIKLETLLKDDQAVEDSVALVVQLADAIHRINVAFLDYPVSFVYNDMTLEDLSPEGITLNILSEELKQGTKNP